MRRHPARESKSDYGRRMLAWSAASVPAYTVRSTMQPANRAGNRLPIGRGRRRCCPARSETILARAVAAALRAARSGLEASNAAVTCGAEAEFHAAKMSRTPAAPQFAQQLTNGRTWWFFSSNCPDSKKSARETLSGMFSWHDRVVHVATASRWNNTNLPSADSQSVVFASSATF